MAQAVNEHVDHPTSVFCFVVPGSNGEVGHCAQEWVRLDVGADLAHADCGFEQASKRRFKVLSEVAG